MSSMYGPIAMCSTTCERDVLVGWQTFIAFKAIFNPFWSQHYTSLGDRLFCADMFNL